MKLRTLSLAVAVLLAACIAVYFLQRPPSPAAQDARIGQPLLAADLAAKSVQVRLSDHGKTVTFKKQADGSWLVPEYFEFSADLNKLGHLITDFTTDIKILRLVTSRPDRLARLEFKETSLALLGPDGKELWHIVLGKYADDGGRYLRFGEEPKAYQVTLNAGLDSDAKSWVDTTLLDLKADDIARLEIGFLTGRPVTASRASKGVAWTSPDTPAGKQLKIGRVGTVLGSLVSLHFADTSDLTAPDVAAAWAHSRTLKLITFDGKTHTLTFGRKPEEKKPRTSSVEAATAAATAAPAPAGEKPAEAKPAEPEPETIPAGPVYARVTCSDEKAPINALMQKRAFQIYEGTFTGLPAKRDELWEDKPVFPSPVGPGNPPKPAGSDKERLPTKP
jgi:hypothetical protein